MNTGLEGAYNALVAVRDSCSHASGDLMGTGAKRAKILVEILEQFYNDALATKETLEQKAYTGMRLMENFLNDLEIQAHAVRDRGFFGTLDDGWKAVEHAREVVDESVERAKEALHHSIERAVELAQENRLISYADLPHPWRINPHIVRGYRFTNSKVQCAVSMFQPSNEFVNIWSHLIGLIVVLSIAFYFYPLTNNFCLSSKTDITIAALFFFSACKCLVCSTVWHTMNSISNQPLMERFACIDYTGISFLVAASIMTTEYTAFYCEPISCYCYIGLSALLGIAGSILPWRPTFNRHDLAWFRVCFYVTLAATGLAPIFQLCYTRGLYWSIYFYAPVVKSVLVYLFGALIYASKIPERWCPGFFDYVGGSHNIWHLAVLGGILFHYTAMQELFAGAFLRAQGDCPAS